MINCNVDISSSDKKVKNSKSVNNFGVSKKKLLKAGKTGKIMVWNKGNSAFLSKKDEMELLLQTHKPLVLGILEAQY